MKWKVIMASVALLLTSVVWMMVASYLFLWMAGLQGRVSQPEIAWWTYVNSGYDDIWTRIYLMSSASLPVIPLIIVVLISARFYNIHYNRPAPIYGNSEAATARDMKLGGIARSKRFF